MWIRILCKTNESNSLDVLCLLYNFSKEQLRLYIFLSNNQTEISKRYRLPCPANGNNPTSEYKKQKKFLYKGPSISQSPALLFVTSLLPHIHIWIFSITVLIVEYPVLPSQCELKLCYYIDVQTNSSRG